jgi:hypothetical protein
MNSTIRSRSVISGTATLTGIAVLLFPIIAMVCAQEPGRHPFAIEETAERITLRGSALEASIKKKGYVSGVEARSFLDKKTGARDLGFGLDIQDWIMEPGSDAAYRSQLTGDLPYDFNNAYHGKTPKRSIEGPQICTQAKVLTPRIIEGKGFVAIEQSWNYTLAAPGKQTGSAWKQTLLFPAGKRYFISSDQILSRNAGEALFFRQDMPGHLKHKGGDTFSEVYLSYRGKIPSSEFVADFAPDEKFNYRRERDGVPQRMIRAYHTRDPKTGTEGPWLAGMTLNPSDTSEAWCHQRTGYVCFIHEVGERPVKAGESFGAAYIVGWFDSIEEMEKVYDQYRGHSALEVTADGWRLVASKGMAPGAATRQAGDGTLIAGGAPAEAKSAVRVKPADILASIW